MGSIDQRVIPHCSPVRELQNLDIHLKKFFQSDNMEQSSQVSEGRSYRDYPNYGYSRDYRQAHDMVGAYSDWERSGGGGGCCCGGGGGYSGGSEASLFSDGTLFALLAGAALAFYILYTTVTMAAAGGRRKRGLSNRKVKENEESPLFDFEEVLWQGLEEFEEKIDKIAEGQDGGDDNWISKIYNQFSFFNDVDNQLTDADMDGLEPPLLDETWGLGVRNASIKNITANATIEEPIKLEDEETSRKKRSVDEDVEEEEEVEDTEEKCRVEMWRCLSKVIEGGLHYIDKPDGLMGLAKKTMFKIAFHGGFSNVWSGVMTIPEARHIKQCMNNHSECVSYEILRREAQETMDPSDPEYQMYNKKKTTKVMEEKHEEKEKKKPKRERLIINPEFVESMDQGDGSVQYDEDYKIEDNEV